MEQKCDPSKARALVQLLQRMDGGENIKLLAKEAGQIAPKIGPAEMAAAERRLLDSGYTEAAVTQLSAAFVLMGVYERQKDRSPGASADSHILQRVSAEHGIFRCLAVELGDALEDVMGLSEISDTSSEFRRLAHAVRHLRAINEHFDREDDVILPYLKARGWTSLCQLVAKDHTQLKASVVNLAGLIATFEALEPEDFKSHLAAGVTSFCRCLSEHLSFEDGLLWPLMLVVVDKPGTWKTIKALCDEIGYCGVHA
jgi:DUF438 domain-containing protein